MIDIVKPAGVVLS